MANFDHTIITKDGGRKLIKNLKRTKAIALHCTECMGWESDPKNCGIKECALYPFRKWTLISYHGDQ